LVINVESKIQAGLWGLESKNIAFIIDFSDLAEKGCEVVFLVLPNKDDLLPGRPQVQGYHSMNDR